MKKHITVNLSNQEIKDVLIRVSQEEKTNTESLDLQDGPIFITANHIDAIKPYISNNKTNTYVLIDETFKGENELESIKAENFDYTKFSGQLPNVIVTDQTLYFASYDLKTEDADAVEAYRDLFQYLYINAKKAYVEIELDVLRPYLDAIEVYDSLTALSSSLSDVTLITNIAFPDFARYVTRLDGELTEKDYYMNVPFSDPLVIMENKHTAFCCVSNSEVLTIKIKASLSPERFTTHKYVKTITAKELYEKSAMTKNKKSLSIEKTIQLDDKTEKLDLLALDNPKTRDSIVAKHEKDLQKQYSGKCLEAQMTINFEPTRFSDIKNQLLETKLADFIKDDKLVSKLKKDIIGSYRMKKNKKELVLVAENLTDRLKNLPNVKYVVVPD